MLRKLFGKKNPEKVTHLYDYYSLRDNEKKTWNQETMKAALTMQNPAIVEMIDRVLPNPEQIYSSETNLVEVESMPLDSHLRDLCNLYRSGSPELRVYIRSKIDEKTGWTLITFSKRLAVLGARKNSTEMIRDALIAHAIENLAWGEIRDNLTAISLILHCARRNKMEGEALFKEAAQISGPAISAVLLDFLERDPENQSIKAMGFEEVMTSKGVGYELSPWLKDIMERIKRAKESMPEK